RLRATARASPERSITVICSKPWPSRLSTKRDAPPPISTIAEVGLAPTKASNSSEGAGDRVDDHTPALRREFRLAGARGLHGGLWDLRLGALLDALRPAEIRFRQAGEAAAHAA